jgi:hypothetical protein
MSSGRRESDAYVGRKLLDEAVAQVRYDGGRSAMRSRCGMRWSAVATTAIWTFDNNVAERELRAVALGGRTISLPDPTPATSAPLPTTA